MAQAECLTGAHTGLVEQGQQEPVTHSLTTS